MRYTIGFLLGVWIARTLGPRQYGLLNYALAFAAVFAFLGTLGLDGLAVRDMVQKPDSRCGTLGTLLVMRLLGGGVMMLATAVSAAILRIDSSAVALILVISLAQWLLAFDSIDCLFQADLTSRRTVIARLTALSIVSLWRVLLILSGAPLIAYAWAIAGESASIAVCMLIAYARSGRRLAGLKPALERARTFLSEGWPLMLVALVAAVSQRIDQVMLGMMANYLQVGAYAVAVRAVEVMYVVPTVVATSVFPAIIKSRALDETTYLGKIQRLCGTMLWAGIGIAVPLSLLSGAIIGVMVGKSYAAAAPVLAILGWMPAFMFFSIARQRWLLAQNALATVMILEVCTCSISVIANLLLIPRYGARGAAIAALTGVAGATLILAPFSRPVRQSLGMLLRAVLAPLQLIQAK